MQILNRQRGALRIGDNFSVERKMKKNKVLHFFKGKEIETDDYGNGWSVIEATNVVVDKYFLSITFRFEGGYLKELDFIVQTHPFKDETSWDNWSLDEEMKTADNLSSWLTEQIGEEREFDWGSIDADFDESSGGTSITIEYS